MNTTGVFNRYDGYESGRTARSDHPTILVAAFSPRSQGRSRFSGSRPPIPRPLRSRHGTLTRCRSAPVQAVSKSTSRTSARIGPGSSGWPRGRFLHRSRSGALRRYSHVRRYGEPEQLAREIDVQGREGTLWVCTAASVEAFDRRTGKVHQPIHLEVPNDLRQASRGPRGRAVDRLPVRQRADLLRARQAAAGALSFKDREPPVAAPLSRAEGSRENADGNLSLATKVAASSESIPADEERFSTDVRRPIRTASARTSC